MALEQTQVRTIGEHFSGLEDPRINRSKLHKLIDIVTSAICAVICGADPSAEGGSYRNVRQCEEGVVEEVS